MRQSLTFPLFLGMFAVVLLYCRFLGFDLDLKGVCSLQYCDFGCGVGIRLMKKGRREEGDEVADTTVIIYF